MTLEHIKKIQKFINTEMIAVVHIGEKWMLYTKNFST